MPNAFSFRYRVLIMLFFLTLLSYFDRVTIALVSVRIKHEFHLTNTRFGWVLAAFALAYALFEIPSGILSDRIGQRSVLIRIVLWWSLFTALTGAATGILSLMFIRILFGIGESGTYPASTGVISRWFPVRETGKSISVLTMGASVGAALAPLIVIPIAAAYGWRMPFFVNGLLGLVWVLICFIWFKDFPAGMKGISKEELMLIETGRRYQRKHIKIDWRLIFRSRSMLALSLMFFCSQCGNYFFIGWMPVYLQEARHFTENEMKLITAAVFFSGIAGAVFSWFITDWLVRKYGLKNGRRLLGASAMALMALLFAVTAFTPDKKIVIIALISAHFFYLPVLISSFSSCVDMGGENAGTVTGIMNFAGQMGSFFLALYFGKIADLTHSFKLPVVILAVILLIGALLWLALDPEHQLNFKESKTVQAA